MRVGRSFARVIQGKASPKRRRYLLIPWYREWSGEARINRMRGSGYHEFVTRGCVSSLDGTQPNELAILDQYRVHSSGL